MNKQQQAIVNNFLNIQYGGWEIFSPGNKQKDSLSVWLVKRNTLDQSVLEYLTVFTYGETKRGLYEEIPPLSIHQMWNGLSPGSKRIIQEKVHAAAVVEAKKLFGEGPEAEEQIKQAAKKFEDALNKAKEKI